MFRTNFFVRWMQIANIRNNRKIIAHICMHMLCKLVFAKAIWIQICRKTSRSLQCLRKTPPTPNMSLSNPTWISAENKMLWNVVQNTRLLCRHIKNHQLLHNIIYYYITDLGSEIINYPISESSLFIVLISMRSSRSSHNDCLWSLSTDFCSCSCSCSSFHQTNDPHLAGDILCCCSTSQIYLTTQVAGHQHLHPAPVSRVGRDSRQPIVILAFVL